MNDLFKDGLPEGTIVSYVGEPPRRNLALTLLATGMLYGLNDYSHEMLLSAPSVKPFKNRDITPKTSEEILEESKRRMSKKLAKRYAHSIKSRGGI